MAEKIIQLIPDIHGTSGQMTTDYYALTEKGNIWYRTTQGWQKESLPLELSGDDPPIHSTAQGKQEFIESIEKELEKEENDKSKGGK